MSIINMPQTYEKCREDIINNWKNIKYVLYPTKNANTTITIEQYNELCISAIDQTIEAFTLVKEQTYDICSYAVKKKYGYALQYVKLQTPELCLESVTTNGLSLRYCKFQSNEICLAAVKQTGLALSHIEYEFMTFEVCLAAVQSYGPSLDDIPKKIIERFNQEEITTLCIEAVKQNGRSLEFVKNKTPEICIEAMKKDIYVLRLVPVHIEKIIGDDKINELCLDSIRKNHYNFSKIPNKTFKICLEAVKICGACLYDIPYTVLLDFTVDQCYEIYLEVIKNNPEKYVLFSDSILTRFSDEQKYNLLLETVKRDGRRLFKDVNELQKYTKEQIYELELAAVKQCGSVLENIKDQTYELCLDAVKQTCDAFKYISDDIIKSLNEKQKFELTQIIYNESMNKIETFKNNILDDFHTQLGKLDLSKDDLAKLQIKIIDVATNKKIYDLSTGKLLDFVKEKHNTATIINNIADAKNEGLYILKINDNCYELIQVNKTVEVVKGWIYNGNKDIYTTQRITVYKNRL